MPGSDWQVTPTSQSAAAGVDTGDYTVELLLSAYPSGAPFDSPFTLNDGGAGGTFTPSSVTILTGQQSATFKYRNSASGTKTLNVSQSDGYSPSSESVSAVITAGGGGGSVSLSGIIAGTERFVASPGLLGGSVGLLASVAGSASLSLAVHSARGFQFPAIGRDPSFAAMTTSRKRGLTFDAFGIGPARRGFGGPAFLHMGGVSGVNQVQFTAFGRNASNNFTTFTGRTNGTTPLSGMAEGSLYFSQQVGLDGPSWTAETLVYGPAEAGHSPVMTNGCGGAFLGNGYLAVFERADGFICSRFTPDPQDWSVNPAVAITDKDTPSVRPAGRVLGVAVNSMGQIAVLTSETGMYVSVSSDLGQTWKVHTFAAPGTSEYAGISAMQELFIVCGWSEASNGMIHLISKDAGATWL